MKHKPKRITPERLAELLPRLKSGDMSVAEEIAEGHVRLVLSLAARYGNEREEYESIAYEVLWTTIIKVAEGHLKHDGFANYLMTRLRSKYANARYRIPTVSLSRSYCVGRGIQRPDRVEMPEPEFVTQDASEMLEDILSVTSGPIEECIVKKRAEGYSDREIGAKIRMSHGRVWEIRKEIEKRYMRLCEVEAE